MRRTMKNRFALALILGAIAIGTVSIAQQPQRVAKVGGYASAGSSNPLGKAPFRVGLIIEAQVPAQEAGLLKELNGRDGQEVKAGVPLGKIDDSQPIMQGRIA